VGNTPIGRKEVKKMVKVKIVVRELGNAKPDYSLLFDLPELPRVGDYISIYRPDKEELYSEDLVVRHVWWRLRHPETRGVVVHEEKIGSVREINVECDPALGPHASDRWRGELEAAKQRGIVVEVFDVNRLSIRESELAKVGRSSSKSARPR
jgi:hypothetical protein